MALQQGDVTHEVPLERLDEGMSAALPNAAERVLGGLADLARALGRNMRVSGSGVLPQGTLGVIRPAPSFYDGSAPGASGSRMMPQT